MQSWSQLVSRLVTRRKRKQSNVQDTSQPATPIAAVTDTATTTAAAAAGTELSTRHHRNRQQHVSENHEKGEEKSNSQNLGQSQKPSSLPSSTPTDEAGKVDVGTLEFPASRDLALTLGDEWNKDDNMVLPSLDHFLPPPSPATNGNSVLRKKSTRNRLSLYRPKSTLHLLRGSKSIPQIVS
ncbi:hypothetical protein BX666DRAFT_2031901 [Dichotomocladium elegans]|nr:hypothetical protein BX666DRAFT_2031901 [Dichotomocladium elegans]